MDINRIEQMIAALSTTITARVKQYHKERTYLTTFDGNTCTGSIHWRDQNKPGVTPKLIIIHSTDQDCPIHGKPQNGQRLRIYVGTDSTKQHAAVEAIERERERTTVARRVRAMETAIHRSKGELNSALSFLGLPHLDPDPNWPTRQSQLSQ